MHDIEEPLPLISSSRTGTIDDGVPPAMLTRAGGSPLSG
jgi:hypothetical protein